MCEVKVIPVIDKRMQGLCRREYKDHPRGCPNWGISPDCPPGLQLFNELVDINKEIIAIYTVFNLPEQEKRMRAKHPRWTIRQCRNSMWWKKAEMKKLFKLVEKFWIREGKKHIIFKIPEAYGVNVTATMKSAGIILQWPPKDKVYMIMLAGLV